MAELWSSQRWKRLEMIRMQLVAYKFYEKKKKVLGSPITCYSDVSIIRQSLDYTIPNHQVVLLLEILYTVPDW